MTSRYRYNSVAKRPPMGCAHSKSVSLIESIAGTVIELSASIWVVMHVTRSLQESINTMSHDRRCTQPQ
jgi:hypothetical protein